MLIGIDFLGVPPTAEAPGAALARSLILAAGQDTRFVVYARDDASADTIASLPRVQVRRPQGRTLSAAASLEQMVQDNPDGLDLLLVADPSSRLKGYALPPRPLHGLPVAALLSGRVPDPYQVSTHDPNPLDRLRQYDLLLVNSEADGDRLRLQARIAVSRISAIGVGVMSDDSPTPTLSSSLRRRLNASGLSGTFLYHAANEVCPREIRRLMDAYALLPDSLRRSLQFVLTLGPDASASDSAQDYAQSLGLDDRIVLTGPLPSLAVRALAARSALAAFAADGTGSMAIPLETLAGGAPVVAVRNPGTVRALGTAGLLVPSDEPAALAAAFARLLTDPLRSAELRRKALARVRGVSWDEPGRRALDALAAVARRPSRLTRGRPDRPRLAVFSPFGPKKSGIATYTTRLIRHLASTYTIDLFHDAGYTPDPALASKEFAAHDYRLFDRLAPVLGYRGILYQMGNSGYHRYLLEVMKRHPGVTTLHDFCLAGYQWWDAHDRGSGVAEVRELFANEVRHSHPARAERYLALLPDWDREPGGVQVAYAKRGLPLNRRVFEASQRVIVHSPWCVDQARRLYPDLVHRAVRVPLGSALARRDPSRVAATRARFGIPQDALVLASFGFLTKDKMNNESVVAFANLARDEPSALLVFVGQDLEGGEARQLAESLGVANRVRFLGHRPDGDFDDLVAATDLGLALRRPPTYGETSAALLDLLRTGIPTIVTDTGTFADYPDGVVRKVRWQAEGLAGLVGAVRDLALDPSAREALGRAAQDYVAVEHSWERAASEYVAVIESAFAERRRVLAA